MPFEKGRSGNPHGRPRQTAEQKSQKEQFQRLLKSSTIDALQSIIQIDVYNDMGVKKHMKVHRLVYMAHVGVIPNGLQVNHKDENKTNNCIDNLELMTNKENCSYGTRNARISKSMKRYRAKQRAMATC